MCTFRVVPSYDVSKAEFNPFPPSTPQPLPTSSRPHSHSFLPRVVTQWDKLTSVAIPVAASVAMMGLIVKGIDDLRYGKNRKEGF